MGKTVAARAAIDRAEPARYHLVYTRTRPWAPEASTTTWSQHWAASPASTTPRWSPKARDALAAEHAERGRIPILCIDEGHLPNHDALDALRLLTNHELDTESPFATIMLGQPTLATKMKLGTLAELEQRITVRRHMTGMTGEETAGHLAHHLKLVGRADPLCTEDAIALIHQRVVGAGAEFGSGRWGLACR